MQYFYRMKNTSPDHALPSALYPEGATKIMPATLFSYTLHKEIPLSYVVYNRHHEPLIIGLDAPAPHLTQALVKDYPEIQWIHDRTRLKAPLYDCRQKKWTSPAPDSPPPAEPVLTRHASAVMAVLLVTGLAILLWALLH